MGFQIAIDGPVAAGKGTVARLVAERLGFLYVDTGAMYRVAAMLAQRSGVDVQNAQGVAALVAQAEIELRNPVQGEQDGRLITVLVNGEDVSWKIRDQAVTNVSSVVAAHKPVREALVRKQQAIATTQDVVMEGRDITFRVLPQAQLKIYLDADVDVRAQRRHQDFLTRGVNISLDEVKQDLVARDQRDMTREVDPLQKVDDAWHLDTTNLTIEQVVDLIVQRVRAVQPQQGS